MLKYLIILTAFFSVTAAPSLHAMDYREALDYGSDSDDNGPPIVTQKKSHNKSNRDVRESYFLKLKTLSQDTDTLNVCESHFYIARYSRFLGELGIASEHYEHAITLSKMLEKNHFTARIYNDRAHMFKDIQEYDSAHQDALDSIWYTDKNDYLQRMYTFLMLAETSTQSKSIKYYKLASENAAHVMKSPKCSKHYDRAHEIFTKCRT